MIEHEPKRWSEGRRWSLVLAAGSGTRLRHLTVDREGRSTPKQFCSVSGGPTLLEETLDRAADLSGLERTVAVVAREHVAWWRRDTAALRRDNVVVQPINRGTAAGILLPLLHVAERDPDARVVVLPSDHYVRREDVLRRAIKRAFLALEGDPSSLVLLGITPDRADTELGWILPRPSDGATIRLVEAFVEKPALPLARQLQKRGGLWNSFIFVARASMLLSLYRLRLESLRERLADAVRRDLAHAGAGAVDALYAELDSQDFSRAVLEASPGALRVLPVERCGWSDLGTPERLARCTQRLAGAVPIPTAAVARPVLAGVV